VPLEPAPAAWPGLDPDGTYLLTGGLGGIGLQVARRLVERGVRRLALLARSAHGPAAEAAVADLRAAGATVELLQADVTSREALDRALGRARGGSGLRGIVHLAGVLDDRPLMSTDEETLAAVVGPKAAGTWHLLELTAADPLDWFVCFSSAASVLGSPGQGAYCAANAVMDAVASQQRSRGRPVCCLNWGPWANEGMAARAGHGSERRFGSAYTALHPADGLDILERALAAGRTGLLVMPFDLRNLLQFYPVGLGLPLYADLTSGEVASLRSIGQGSQPARRPDLGQAYVAPRTEVEERIASVWQASLGLDRIGVLDEFFALGGDSVFANEILVEVGRSLGASLDAARAFENFTIAGLAALAEEAVLERLEGMTDEEAGRLAGGSDPGGAG
jgi:NAD(P)-dependent dehydrogenase (short-subunit alcohol dehydrogenase family)